MAKKNSSSNIDSFTFPKNKAENLAHYQQSENCSETELRLLSEDLAGANEDLSNIKESIDFPLIVVDTGLRIRRSNQAARELFVIRGDPSGETLFDVVSTIEIPELIENVSRVISSGEAFSRQIDITDYSYCESIQPYRTTDNSVLGAVLTYRDITEARKIERQLRESEERFDLAVKGSGAGIWDWNILTGDLYLSPLCEQVLGIAGKRTIHVFNDFLKMIHEDEFNDVKVIIDAHLRCGFECDIEFRIIRDDNSECWVHLCGQAAWDQQNKPYRMTGSIYDVTQRRVALKQLTQSNNALERFLYVCSHDLREPARIIENFSELFSLQYSDKLDPDALVYLKHIRESSAAMQDMIRGILEYSRLANKSVAKEYVDTKLEVERVLSNLALSIEETGANIVFGTLPVITADRMQIFLIFQNLVSNSLKFCKGNSPEVFLDARNTGREWEFSVRDNGIGIEQRYSRKIFDVFQRLNHREDYSGTGMGLSICRKIVKAHGGRIWVESSPGNGSTFYFTIPFKRTQGNGDDVSSIDGQTG